MPAFATAGAAMGCPQINQFTFRLTGADVMHWQQKSRLQQLWERLKAIYLQKGQP